MTREEALQVCHGLESNWFMSDEIREAMTLAIEALKQQEQNKAQWIEDGYNDEPCVCSRCGQPGKYEWWFCPNCGAEMEEK